MHVNNREDVSFDYTTMINFDRFVHFRTIGKKPNKSIMLSFLFILFYLYIYPPDLQESDGGANT